MSFISFAFMAFLPIAVLVNFIVPAKYRYIWLLIVSMVFYSTAGIDAVGILLLSILSVYTSGIYIGKKKGMAKLVLFLCLLFNIGILFVFKYLNFFMVILEKVTLGSVEAAHFNMILPLGLSFYILKSV